MTPPVPARDASSLVLLRESAAGPQVYMVRRHPRSAFMAGALVFVGGSVDEADSAPDVLEVCSGLSPEDAARRLGIDDLRRAMAFYVAAIRECLEEAGILVAHATASLDAAALEGLRTDLAGGTAPLASLLRERGLTLAVDHLRYLDHWITPEFEPRRYDTRFFVCRAPAGQEGRFNPHETTSGKWLTATEALEGNRTLRFHLAPPTLLLLEGLATHGSVEAALAAAPDAPVRATRPKPLLGQPGPLTLLLPGDHRYDDPASVSGPLHFVALEEGRWVRVRR